MEALGINIGYLIMQILIITIMLLLMKGMVYKPILRVLDERKARIAKGLEDSRQAAIARDNADVEAKKILDTARQEAAKIRQEAVAQADETAKVIEAKANEEARGIVAAAAGGNVRVEAVVVNEFPVHFPEHRVPNLSDAVRNRCGLYRVVGMGVGRHVGGVGIGPDSRSVWRLVDDVGRDPS